MAIAISFGRSGFFESCRHSRISKARSMPRVRPPASAASAGLTTLAAFPTGTMRRPTAFCGAFCAWAMPTDPSEFRALQELRQPLGFRLAEQFLGRSLFLDPALVHAYHTIRNFEGEYHLVSDQQHGHAFSGEVLDDGLHLMQQFRIERRGHRVEKHDLEILRNGAGDGVALLLTAGKLASRMI